MFVLFFFFFKQKTAYEMRISDWSSDVCSSDLMVDAPVSGGIAAAAGGTLTFMVGGTDNAFERAKPILSAMGKTVIHAGDAGNGKAAKICNNMLLGATMVATCETFREAERRVGKECASTCSYRWRR